MPPITTRPLRRGLITALGALSLLSLSACGGSGTDSKPSPSNEQKLTISQPWVKVPKEGMDMTGVFGQITNTTNEPIAIDGAESGVAGMAELHETVQSNDGSKKMQRKEGGFVVPAKGDFELNPGENHIMLMKIKDPIKPGDEIPITLNIAGGGTLDFTAQAKEFSGGNENYTQ